jgi:23S rRNA (guanosine2251-2'-O)-methyltransferase
MEFTIVILGMEWTVKVLYDKARLKHIASHLRYIRAMGKEYGFAVEESDDATIASLAVGTSHGGILTFCTDRELPKLSDITHKDGFYVLLGGIEDPYNFGYALRSLYAAGADGVILPKRNWMTAAGVVCRASAGASERFPMYVAQDGVTAVSMLREHGCKIVCADIDNSVSVYDADLTRPLFLIVGGEKRDISRSVLAMADAVVRLDYGREFDAALSAASASSILAFEVYRQNR